MAATQAARARSPQPIDVDEEDDDDYFDALDEQLEQLGAPPDPDKSLADRFGGHPLPLDHVARLWPRDANFQPRTCHYHPGLAGDRLNGGLVDTLTKIGEKQHAEGKPEWGATYAYELRTLVAACSYMADAFAAQRATCTAVNSALRAGHAMPDGLESLPQDSLDMAVQLQSVLSHLKERVDVLRATARQGVDVEILARLYDSEERIAGDRSELGAAVEARALEGATRNMIAAAAKERVAAATGAAHLTPRGPRRRESAPAAAVSRALLGIVPGGFSPLRPAADRIAARIFKVVRPASRSTSAHHAHAQSHVASQRAGASSVAAGRRRQRSRWRRPRWSGQRSGRLGSAQRPGVFGETARPRRDPPLPTLRHQHQQIFGPASLRLRHSRRHRRHDRPGCPRCSSACARTSSSGARLAPRRTYFAGSAKVFASTGRPARPRRSTRASLGSNQSTASG